MPGMCTFAFCADRHRAEGAACTVYLLPRDPFAEPAAEQTKGKGSGRKSKETQPQKCDTSRGNPVTVAVDDSGIQLLGIQDRHSELAPSAAQITSRMLEEHSLYICAACQASAGSMHTCAFSGISHGSSLQLPKLHLFLHPSQHLLPDYYDPHVYVFAHATLKIFDQPSLRHSLYSIRVSCRIVGQGKHETAGKICGISESARHAVSRTG